MIEGTEKPAEDALEELARLRERVRILEASSDCFEMLMEADTQKQLNAEALMRQLKQSLDANRRQLESIAQVQDRFLESPFQTGAGIGLAARCRPCADVGGDFYFAGELPDGRTALCMADIAGHGAVAAVNMAITRSLLRAAMSDCSTSEGPSEIFVRLGTWLEEEFDLEQFVTMWLGIWDPQSATISYSVAAHPDAIIWRRGDNPRFLAGGRGLPLGLSGIEPIYVKAEQVSLNVGDRVFLYTDAWTETPSETGEVLDGDALLDFISHAYRQPLRAVPDILFMEFERHVANMRIRDDLSLLVFERTA